VREVERAAPRDPGEPAVADDLDPFGRAGHRAS
jgi:hypothetical protein